MAYRDISRSHRKELSRRLPDFWEIARGCGLGYQCDDAHSQEGVETIFVPDTLWSDLPAVYVGAEWEPVSAPQSRNVSRSQAPMEATPPSMMALRWDAGADFMQERLPAAAQRASNKNQRKFASPDSTTSSSQQMLEWEPTHECNEWGMDSVLSEASAPVSARVPPPVPLRPPSLATRQAPTSRSSSRRQSPRMQMSKGGDSAASGGWASSRPGEFPLEMHSALDDLPFSEMQPASSACSAASSRSNSLCTPRRHFNRVPRKIAPDDEVVDDPALVALEKEAQNKAPSSLVSFFQSVVAASMQADAQSSSPSRPRPALPEAEFALETPSVVFSPSRERREDRDAEHAEPDIYQAVSKAEASGGRLRPDNDSNSTTYNEAGADNRGDEAVSLISGASSDTTSFEGGLSFAPPPRAPLCVLRSPQHASQLDSRTPQQLSPVSLASTSEDSKLHPSSNDQASTSNAVYQ
jgi:hypothetical protein